MNDSQIAYYQQYLSLRSKISGTWSPASLKHDPTKKMGAVSDMKIGPDKVLSACNC